MRLGVSPAAASTPTGGFNQRFEASLFPSAGALGYTVCFAPRRFSGLSVRECGVAGSASGPTACPVHPTLCQSRWPVSVPPRQRESSPPRCPSVPLLPVWMNVNFYLLGVGLPCRSIFCQFWLCEEAQWVYLRRHLGSPPRIYSCDTSLKGEIRSVRISHDSHSDLQ